MRARAHPEGEGDAFLPFEISLWWGAKARKAAAAESAINTRPIAPAAHDVLEAGRLIEGPISECELAVGVEGDKDGLEEGLAEEMEDHPQQGESSDPVTPCRRVREEGQQAQDQTEENRPPRPGLR